MSSGVRQATETLDRRLGDPPVLEFPPGWTLSTSWQRAQREDDLGGPLNAAERTVWLEDSDEPHRVLFALRGSQLLAECDCDGYRFNDGWCAHVASCWWRWSRDDLAVTDLDTDKTHLHPPWWLSVRGEGQ